MPMAARPVKQMRQLLTNEKHRSDTDDDSHCFVHLEWGGGGLRISEINQWQWMQPLLRLNTCFIRDIIPRVTSPGKGVSGIDRDALRVRPHYSVLD